MFWLTSVAFTVSVLPQLAGLEGLFPKRGKCFLVVPAGRCNSAGTLG